MPLLLVLVFVGIPLLEILVILQVGQAIGGWPTAGILVADSLVGAWLLRVEGRRAWSEFRRALAEGRWPGDEVAQGALIIVGGTLLLTPGFVTDGVGFLLLIAPTRRLVAGRVRSRVGEAADPRRAKGRARPGGRRSRDADAQEVPLDVEVVEIERLQPPLDPSPDEDGGDDTGGDEPRTG